MGVKRNWTAMDDSTPGGRPAGRARDHGPNPLREKSSNPDSPFLPMFEKFRDELDEHHDRRERVIKASRDITAASKKIIFSLQRVREVGKPIPDYIENSHKDFQKAIRAHYAAIAPDLQGINAYRYRGNISGGCQEFIEAVTFEHYLETGLLLSYGASARLVAAGGKKSDGDSNGDNTAAPGVLLQPEDYLLGMYDMTVELMRFAITTMAIYGTLPLIGEASTENNSTVRRSILTDMRDLRSGLEAIDAGTGPFARDVDKKAEVMRASVEKVERAIYGIVVRGAERPSGWMPDMSDSTGVGRAVETEA